MFCLVLFACISATWRRVIKFLDKFVFCIVFNPKMKYMLSSLHKMGIDYLSNKIPWLRILIIRHSLKEPFICLISRYILRSGQRGRCCFCAACPNRKMYLDIRNADEGLLRSFGGSTHGMNSYHPSQPHSNILLYQHFMRLKEPFICFLIRKIHLRD